MDRKTIDTLAVMLYITHCKVNEVEPDWNSLERDDEVYWFTMAFAAVEVLKTPSETMTTAALKEMASLRPVKEGETWQQFNSDLFTRSFTAAMSQLTVNK